MRCGLADGNVTGNPLTLSEANLVFLDPSRQMECAFLMQTQCHAPSYRPGLLLEFTG